MKKMEITEAQRLAREMAKQKAAEISERFRSELDDWMAEYLGGEQWPEELRPDAQGNVDEDAITAYDEALYNETIDLLIRSWGYEPKK